MSPPITGIVICQPADRAYPVALDSSERISRMTKVLVAAAALTFSVASAMACPYAKDTTASAEQQTKVASIGSQSAPAPAQQGSQRQ